MLNWHTITNLNTYITERYRFVKYVEEGGPNPRLAPYNDKAKPGVAGFITIGVGFNLEDEAVGAAGAS